MGLQGTGLSWAQLRGKPIDEKDGCNVCPWQQLEEGPESIGQQEDPNRREDGSKRDLHVKSCW